MGLWAREDVAWRRGVPSSRRQLGLTPRPPRPVLSLPRVVLPRTPSSQAGINVPGLDTSYVSSSSWYMMTAFGLPRLMQLFTRSASGAVDEAKMMQMQVRCVRPWWW